MYAVYPSPLDGIAHVDGHAGRAELEILHHDVSDDGGCLQTAAGGEEKQQVYLFHDFSFVCLNVREYIQQNYGNSSHLPKMPALSDRADIIAGGTGEGMGLEGFSDLMISSVRFCFVQSAV